MPAPLAPSAQQPVHKTDNRVLWIITGYAASFLGLLAVLVYYWQQLPQ